MLMHKIETISTCGGRASEEESKEQGKHVEL